MTTEYYLGIANGLTVTCIQNLSAVSGILTTSADNIAISLRWGRNFTFYAMEQMAVYEENLFKVDLQLTLGKLGRVAIHV